MPNHELIKRFGLTSVRGCVMLDPNGYHMRCSSCSLSYPKESLSH